MSIEGKAGAVASSMFPSARSTYPIEALEAGTTFETTKPGATDGSRRFAKKIARRGASTYM